MSQARDICAARGDMLVKPNSELKNRFLKEKLRSLNPEAVWIGAMKNPNDGKWYYTDGSVVSFTNWAPGSVSIKQLSTYISYLMAKLQNGNFAVHRRHKSTYKNTITFTQ